MSAFDLGESRAYAKPIQRARAARGPETDSHQNTLGGAAAPQRTPPLL
jgi:hypothetical protein